MRSSVFAHEPIECPTRVTRLADVTAGVAAINAFIEARVRERPGEWWWVHKRWPREDYARLPGIELFPPLQRLGGAGVGFLHTGFQ